MPPTSPPPARPGPTARELLAGLGLLADGPVLWGAPLRSAKPGIFVVEIAAPHPEMPVDHHALRAWLERVPELTLDGKTPTPHELAAHLRRWWLPGETILYVGSTTRSLAGRAAALAATPIGDRRPFGSAWRLRVLKDLAKLRLWWAETEAAEEYADAAFEAFARGVDPAWTARLPDPTLVLPYGNVEAPDGRKVEHGLANLFRPDEEAAVKPGTALSGAAGGPMAKPSTRARAASARATAERAPRKPRAAAAQAEATPTAPVVTHLTAAGLEALKAELEHLTTVERPAIVARIKAARELGDLRENADYEAARREQSFLEGRVSQIDAMLHSVIVIDDMERTHVVGIGSVVTVEHDGTRETYTVVGRAEAKPGERRISDTSPLGRALIGAAAGDEISVAAPSGSRTYRVVEVG
jgi:transcription elongation factor GreA